MRSIRPAFVHLVLFSAFINVSGFAGYFFGIQVLDRVMTTLSYGTLAGLGVFFLIALVLGTMLRAYRASILRRLGIAFNDQISHRIYDA
ncbi:type I secretion system permease/ATPase, partial [Escherichia coli]|nr:type I secretion system permease/ATPase [Escherichia coli]